MPTNPFNNYHRISLWNLLLFLPPEHTIKVAWVTLAVPAGGPVFVLRCLVLLPARLPGPNNEALSPILVSRSKEPFIGLSRFAELTGIRA